MFSLNINKNVCVYRSVVKTAMSVSYVLPSNWDLHLAVLHILLCFFLSERISTVFS